MVAESFIGAFVGHLVGDYLLQNDWMSEGKKKEHYICFVHCLLWTAAVLAFSGWLSLGLKCFYITLVLLATHFVQDRTNLILWSMNHKGQKRFAQPPLAPWSIIVVDNVWHIVTLFFVWRFMT